MDYPTALRFLDKLASEGIKLGLTNVSKILEYFGNPHLKVPTIHIAGKVL